VRERLSHLLDDDEFFLELGLWAGYKMYPEEGEVPAAGVVAGIGLVQHRPVMIVANDATVKAGAFFPATVKKFLRAQRIAFECSLPLIYLVDSAGAYLPMQDEIFPDEDDFGRIFRNNSVLSAAGLPQYAAIMGNCIAGGAYLPVLSDKILMTEGSGLYLAGPALVKAAIGQDVDDETLGGASMHAEISGTIDFREPDDEACLRRLRSIMRAERSVPNLGDPPFPAVDPARPTDDVYDVFQSEPVSQYDMLDLLACVVDAGSLDEYKADYGRSLVCGYARIGGWPCGIVANQRAITRKKMPGGKAGPSTAINMPAVIYDDSADKAARFIMDCNQKRLPILFVHDTTGFMVGRDSEQAGIIRSGAKMVNAMSNCVVPKISLIVGGSYGAGNYAMCGRAFDPMLSLAWPGARCAVMGAQQAASVLLQIDLAARARRVVLDAAGGQAVLRPISRSDRRRRHAAARPTRRQGSRRARGRRPSRPERCARGSVFLLELDRQARPNVSALATGRMRQFGTRTVRAHHRVTRTERIVRPTLVTLGTGFSLDREHEETPVLKKESASRSCRHVRLAGRGG